MATRELLSHSTMEEGSKEARRKRRHRGGTEDKSRVFLLLLTSALTLVNVGAEPQGAGEHFIRFEDNYNAWIILYEGLGGFWGISVMVKSPTGQRFLNGN